MYLQSCSEDDTGVIRRGVSVFGYYEGCKT